MEITEAQKAFKNFKFGSEYYKGENVNTPKIMSAIRKIIIGENPSIMLDVGCGNGMYSKLFPNAKYWGIDIADDIIEHAKSQGLHVVKGDIEKRLPFKDNSFDAVLSMDVMEHTYDTLHHLQEIHRVLKPNGFIILVTPNIASLSARLRVLKGERPAEVDAMRSKWEDQDHISAFGIKDIKQLFNMSNFKIEKLSGMNSGWFTSGIMQWFVDRGMFVSLSSSFLVKARPIK